MYKFSHFLSLQYLQWSAWGTVQFFRLLFVGAGWLQSYSPTTVTNIHGDCNTVHWRLLQCKTAYLQFGELILQYSKLLTLQYNKFLISEHSKLLTLQSKTSYLQCSKLIPLQYRMRLLLSNAVTSHYKCPYLWISMYVPVDFRVCVHPSEQTSTHPQHLSPPPWSCDRNPRCPGPCAAGRRGHTGWSEDSTVPPQGTPETINTMVKDWRHRYTFWVHIATRSSVKYFFQSLAAQYTLIMILSGYGKSTNISSLSMYSVKIILKLFGYSIDTGP